jgi:hypothetical protein
MDLFSQWLENSWMKNAQDKKAIMVEKRAACSCPHCPSYNRCADECRELVYCISGKSPLCISEDRGCTCRKCSVTPELGLQYHDFCIKGSEAAQRYEHEVH